MSKRRPEPDITDTIISGGIHIKGDLSSDNNVWIDGQVEGSVITQESLTLEQNTHIEGDLRGRAIRVNGRVHGDVHAEESLVCGATAVIRGNINTPNLTVENGAVLEGTVTVGEDKAREAGGESETEEE